MASVSFIKVLQVLDLVQESSRGLTFEEISSAIEAPRSTLYRYLKALTDAGFLVSLPNTGFTLGPRIAELDYKMRRHDRLILLGRPVMAELVQTETAVALLCRLYRAKVLCIHQEAHPDALHSNYERGLARPLLRGAASRAILAHMPPRTIVKLYEGDPDEFRSANLGNTLEDVKRTLRGIRQAGWESVAGQVTPGATGIAAPIFDGRGSILGSLSLTLKGTKHSAKEINRIAGKVSSGAGFITNAIANPVAAGETKEG
jgi:DNA-binding IclR family transcriptional regulator